MLNFRERNDVEDAELIIGDIGAGGVRETRGSSNSLLSEREKRVSNDIAKDGHVYERYNGVLP